MPHNRIVISGTLGSEEVWSTSLRFTSSADPGQPVTIGVDEMTTWASDIFAGLGTTLTILRNCLSTTGKVTGVQVQLLDNEGSLASQGVKAIGSVTGLGTPSAPFQTSVVISDITGVPGARHRGRHYWPLVAPGMNSAGRLTTPTDTDDIAANWVSLINHIKSTAPDGDPLYVMFSPTREAVTAVTQVRVGDVPDTQRRRRDSLTENYFSLAV